MERNKSSLVRLNKYLAQCGVASRRKADELIEAGSVQVNGKTVYELGSQVLPGRDRISVKGKPVQATANKYYLAFYKPENVLTSMSDPLGRPTIKDFLEELPFRVFPVGRLDWDTEGLLLLTNDGEFAQSISHPKKGIPKTYLVKLNGSPTRHQFDKLLRGVTIPGGKASALHVERAPMGDSEKYTWIKIVITEGRNRQVRKMMEKIGFDVKKLKRVAIGQLQIGKLKKGQMLFLGAKGIKEALSTEWESDAKRSHRRAGHVSSNKPGKPPRQSPATSR